MWEIHGYIMIIWCMGYMGHHNVHIYAHTCMWSYKATWMLLSSGFYYTENIFRCIKLY